MSAKDSRRLDPPYDMNGSGTPVRGMMWDHACQIYDGLHGKNAKIPPASNLPNRSGAFSAIRKIYTTKK